ncbi:MAG: menaquinone biosynthesis protein [Geobacteraceae bacterium]|nr:menaquinone biosynthesis protein [Geobacteraceae bacterium]
MGLCIGQIDYANCFPIFSALRKNFDCSAYRFVRGTPSALNQQLLAGDIDLCPSSSIAYARSAQTLRLIPGLSISSVGPVKSVKLFSRLPLEKLDSTRIGLTVESETSIALLKIILQKFYRFTNEFIPVVVDESSAVGDTCPAILVIGDTALKWSLRFPDLYQYDLGELWFSLTGLPFVFALWMIRDDVVSKLPWESARVRADLLDAKRIAVSSLGELVSVSTEYNWMEPDALLDYWKTISYDLTPWHLEGVKTFFQSAREIGILEREPAIRFF